MSNLVGSYNRLLHIKINRKFRSKGTCNIISNAHKINDVEKCFGDIQKYMYNTK